MPGSPLGLILFFAALGLLATAAAPRALRHAAWVAPAMAALALWLLLAPDQPQATPASGYGAVKVTLRSVLLAPGEPLTLGGPHAMIALLDTDGESPAEPAAAARDIRFRVVARGADLVLERFGGADVIVRVEPADTSRLVRLLRRLGPMTGGQPQWLGAAPLPTVGRCDPPYQCEWWEEPAAWARPKRPCLAVRDAKTKPPGPAQAMARKRSYREADDSKADGREAEGFRWAVAGPDCPTPKKDELALMAGGTGLIQRVDAGTSIALPDYATLTVFQLGTAPKAIPGLGAESGTVRQLTRLTVRLVTDSATGADDKPVRRLEVTFPAPPVQRFLRDRLPHRLRLGSATDADAAATPDSAVALFPLLGEPFAADLAPVELDDRGVSVANGVTRQQGSDLAVVGDRHQLHFDVVRSSFASGYAIRDLALMALATGILASVGLRRRSAAAAVLFGVLDILLVLRLLIAVEGAVGDADLDGQAYPANALLAMAALPPLLVMVWPRHDTARPSWGSVAAWAVGIAAAVVLIGLAAPPFNGIMVWPLPETWADAAARLAASTATGFDAWAATAGLALLAGLWRVIGGLSSRRPGLTADAAKAVPSTHRQGAWTLTVALLLAAVIMLLRVLFREAWQIQGTRIATSLVITPLTLIGFAWLFARTRTTDGLTSLWTCVTFLLLLATIGLGSYLASDSGYMIMAWPVAAAAALLWAERSPRPMVEIGAALLLLAFAMVGGVLWLNGLPILATAVASIGLLLLAMFCWRLRPTLALVWPLPVALFAAMAVAIAILPHVSLPERPVSLAEANSIDRNRARVYAPLAPQRFAMMGTRYAMEFAGVQAVVDDYTSPARPSGEGYLTAGEPVSAVHDTHQTDHAAAVHLIHPHGGLAALALLLVEASLVILAWRWRGPGFAGWLALLSALTLALVTAYMVLGNLGAMPFTGRNMYLLAPLSVGDVIESWLLLAMLACGLARERPE